MNINQKILELIEICEDFKHNFQFTLDFPILNPKETLSFLKNLINKSEILIDEINKIIDE